MGLISSYDWGKREVGVREKVVEREEGQCLTCVFRDEAEVHLLGSVGRAGELGDVDGEKCGHEGQWKLMLISMLTNIGTSEHSVLRVSVGGRGVRR